jgi:tetratricopeptide (TPR) repeat protein
MRIATRPTTKRATRPATKPATKPATRPAAARPLALALACTLASAGTGTASADDAKRKGTSDKFAKAAGEAFRDALTADQAGDLRTALGLYQKAYGISPHPSTVYNIADVQRRLQLFPDALKSYETYLALAPAADDRRDVEATIDKLARTPGTLYLLTADASDPNAVDWKSAYVLVDGEIKLRPGAAPQPQKEHGNQLGFALAIPAGTHIVDVVTPITHGHQTCRVEVGSRGACRLTAKPRIDGRLVVNASSRSLSVRAEFKDRLSISGSRVELPPGKRKLLVRDRSFECRPIPVELPAGGDVQYVFVATAEYEFERCRALDIKQQRLAFAP